MSKYLLQCSCIKCRLELSVQNLGKHLPTHSKVSKSNCLECNSPLYKMGKFCNHKCSASYNNRHRVKIEKECLRCGELLKDTRRDFCSTRCRRANYIHNWLSGNIPMIETYYGINNCLAKPIRDYLLFNAKYSCEECGWAKVNKKTGLVPVQINHKDGDSTNNNPKNLEVLCPNCHSLTDTHGRHGKGRKKRYAGTHGESHHCQ